MKTHRVWLEIVVFGTAIACAIAVLFAIVGTAAGTGTSETFPSQVHASAAQQSYEGMVTCSRCGARHAASLARSAATCARECVHSGAAFALVDADSIYLLSGHPVELKRVAGQRARVLGSLSGNVITVSSVIPN
jgi:hypothetical protein